MSFASLTPFLGVSYMEVESVSRARSGDNQDKRPKMKYIVQNIHIWLISSIRSVVTSQSQMILFSGKRYNHMRVEIPPLAR